MPRFNARSEFKSAFPGGIGERFDAPVIEIGAAVEDDLGDTGGLGAFRDEFADLDRRLLVGAGLQLAAEILLQARRRGDRVAALVVDHLRIDVRRGAEDGQPRTPASYLL